MVRNVVKHAACAAVVVAFAAVPATAYGTESVDERTGPVAFANAAALAVVDDGSGSRGGSVISETQRSPLLPGTSRLARNRSRLPQSEAERDAAGPNYLVRIGEHDVTATLRDTYVPTAVAEADFVLRDQASDTTVLRLRSAHTEVECLSPDRVRERSTAGRLSLLNGDGELRSVELPDGDGTVKREGLPFGPPVEVTQDGVTVTSDVTIRRVTSFDQLLRQDQWRDGDVTAVAGWLVEVVSHIEPIARPGDSETAEPTTATNTTTATDTNEPTETSRTTTSVSSVSSTNSESTQRPRARRITTKLVLGGVSCSLPTGFTARSAAQQPTRPSVPLTIPAGVEPARAATTTASSADTSHTVGVGLLGGGVALGALALLLVLRRRASAARRVRE